MSPVTVREMLECGVHFGHPTRRWNPKMKKYIFGERNGISIIDLQKTARFTKEALKFVFETAANGGNIMFVGTKRQSVEVIKEAADRCEGFYVNHRWLGGLMTNFITIQQSVKKMKKLEDQLGDPAKTKGLKKKELLKMEKQLVKLDRVLHGIRDMRKLPSVIFVVDVMKEHLAIAEANKLNIPVIALVDSNCDPDPIDYVIPANDDAIRSIGLFANKVADAMLEGQKVFQAKKAEEEAKKAEERAKLEKQRAEEKARRDKERKAREKAAKQQKAEKEAAKDAGKDAEVKASDSEKTEEATETKAPAEKRKPARAKKKAAPKEEKKAAEEKAPESKEAKKDEE